MICAFTITAYEHKDNIYKIKTLFLNDIILKILKFTHNMQYF